MKTLTIDLHPGAGKPITYSNATSWDWDDYGIRVELDNGTIVRFNSTYVIALVRQEIEEEPPVPLITTEEQDALLGDESLGTARLHTRRTRTRRHRYPTGNARRGTQQGQRRQPTE
jgi:hypothetical protein